MLNAKCRTILKKRLPFSGSGLLFEEHETVSLFLRRKTLAGDLCDADAECLFYLPARGALPEPGDRIRCENKEYLIRKTSECRGVDQVLQAVKCNTVELKKTNNPKE